MIPKGYKQTEIGVIPEDWDCVAAKHLMKIETGSRNTEHKTDIGKYPFFVRSQKVERIDTYHYDCEAVLTAGDGVGTGKVFHHYIGKFDAHQRVYVMSNFDGITGRYFYNYFSENFGNEVSKYTAKSSVDSVRRDMIAEMLIPTPTIPEQERIAEALSDVDSMISSLEKLIAKKKAVKQGTMQELLTGKKRLPGFEGEWTTKAISDIAIILDDHRIPVKESDREKMGGNIPYCGANGVLGYVNDYTIDDEIILIAEDGGYFDEYATRPIAYKMYGKCWVNNHAHIITAKSFTNQDYLFYSLVHKDIRDFITSGTRSKLNKAELLKITVTLPVDFNEQTAIASILSDIDNEIEALEQKLEKTRQIKQGMMQQLLTGKIRLV